MDLRVWAVGARSYHMHYTSARLGSIIITQEHYGFCYKLLSNESDMNCIKLTQNSIVYNSDETYHRQGFLAHKTTILDLMTRTYPNHDAGNDLSVRYSNEHYRNSIHLSKFLSWNEGTECALVIRFAQRTSLYRTPDVKTTPLKSANIPEGLVVARLQCHRKILEYCDYSTTKLALLKKLVGICVILASYAFGVEE
ncbi:hypothetical protein L873DRAFT_1845573 [Choiromyces venosus 120613-1]|uniref:Uncharacterized protein n=1 Tax=Choiromyces venosus 120613-1 TaxID=1336337 RepID=A0A3N4JFK5_9PEZI|nr:hypothetical protein L873DRAFT_1845573 [Choiromyces venosus 120613-1]